MTSPPPSQADSERAALGPITPLSLIERVRARDSEAWHRLLALYRPLVLTWCDRASVNVTDAEDVAQEVFTSVSAALDRFRRDRPGDTFRGWLRIITRNQILQLFRKNKERVQAEGGSRALHNLEEIVDPLPGPGEEESLEIGALYLRALEMVRCEFEERTWQAFWLSVIEDREPSAIAQELNMSANSIRQAKSRVLRRLREEVGDQMD